jgi:hypothetical protein
VFPGPRGAPLGRDAVRRLVSRHTTAAAERCPSLAEKTVSPHTYADLLVMPTSRESPCRFGRSSHWGRHNPPALKGLPKRAAAGLRGRSHRLHRFLQGAPMADVRGDPPASRLFSSRLLVVEARSQQKRTTGARGRSLPPPLA